MVYILPFFSYFAGSKGFLPSRPSDPDSMTNTTLKADASFCGKNLIVTAEADGLAEADNDATLCRQGCSLDIERLGLEASLDDSTSRLGLVAKKNGLVLKHLVSTLIVGAAYASVSYNDGVCGGLELLT